MRTMENLEGFYDMTFNNHFITVEVMILSRYRWVTNLGQRYPPLHSVTRRSKANFLNSD
jgi:hypothetical protein